MVQTTGLPHSVPRDDWHRPTTLVQHRTTSSVWQISGDRASSTWTPRSAWRSSTRGSQLCACLRITVSDDKRWGACAADGIWCVTSTQVLQTTEQEVFTNFEKAVVALCLFEATLEDGENSNVVQDFLNTLPSWCEKIPNPASTDTSIMAPTDPADGADAMPDPPRMNIPVGNLPDPSNTGVSDGVLRRPSPRPPSTI